MVDIGNTPLVIEQTIDGAEIGSIWLNDDIFARTADARAAEAGKDVIQAVLNIVGKDDDHVFLSVKAGDELIGIISSHSFRDGQEIHPIILEDYRLEYSSVAIGMAIEWVYENKECTKVYTQIPVIYRAMINFAKKRGFKTVEILKNNRHTPDGNVYDVNVLLLEKRDYVRRS